MTNKTLYLSAIAVGVFSYAVSLWYLAPDRGDKGKPSETMHVSADIREKPVVQRAVSVENASEVKPKTALSAQVGEKEPIPFNIGKGAGKGSLVVVSGTAGDEQQSLLEQDDSLVAKNNAEVVETPGKKFRLAAIAQGGKMSGPAAMPIHTETVSGPSLGNRGDTDRKAHV